jgi:hypothetical protein
MRDSESKNARRVDGNEEDESESGLTCLAPRRIACSYIGPSITVEAGERLSQRFVDICVGRWEVRVVDVDERACDGGDDVSAHPG